MQGKNPLRGVTQEIDYEMKLDAFMTLMEVQFRAKMAAPLDLISVPQQSVVRAK